MNLKVIIAALRAGQELPHSTGVKWAGLAFTGVSLALTALTGVALGRGWIQTDIPPEQIYELSSLLVSIVLGLLGIVQAATTPRVGILPSDRRHPAGDQPDGLHDQSLPSGPDAPEQRESSGLPRGPFFDA